MNLRFALVCITLLSFVPVHASAAAESPVDYLQQIKPLLKDRCYACHGALKQAGGLRLDTAAAAHRGGESGPALKPGDVTASLILQRVITTDEATRMPQDGAPLKGEEIALLRKWIEQQAIAPADETPERDPRDHWAFRPRVRPPVPTVPNAAWVRNPIDAFIAAHHATHGLTPQPPAPRGLLLRRLFLDLIGLPPSPDEIALAESLPEDRWYEATVTKLLDDPRHGERWARHWMDVWRYSDWWGLGAQLRNSQEHIWHWRDWIVESLYDDVPYDEMVRQMLAADELYPDDLAKLRASGYLARNYYLFNRNQWMEETVEHVSKGFLGLTMNCSKCHDHKYDPLPQADYYNLRAFFEPYHVRMDMLPGEADFKKNGLPRAFDGVPEVPTYLFVRGQESQPDKSTVMTPNVPAFLSFSKLDIQPVSLPPSAWDPGRRPWVADALRADAERAVANAKQAVIAAQGKLVAAKQRHAELVAAGSSITLKPAMPAVEPIVEAFPALDATRWKLFGGEWVHTAGRLEQKRDGATRSVLRYVPTAPRDFDVSLRFTTLGGSQWRSVGIVFDSTNPDPTRDVSATESEQLVYVSAFAGGPKVQAAYTQQGKWVYPNEAAVRQAIQPGKEYTLRVQVRGDLINAALNGEPVLAWRTPLERRDGALQFVTFDALAVFHEISITPLAAGVMLREPKSGPPATPRTVEAAAVTLKDAEIELQVSEAAVRVAEAELVSLEVRATASAAPDDPAANRAAIRSERQVALAKARHKLVSIELRWHRAAADKREAIEKERTVAQADVEKAVAQVDAPEQPAERFTPLVGAQWSATRFRNSGADDPKVPFLPTSTGRRSALARWITDAQNPLTARVAVNHLWTRHFGTPLVATVFDFGRKGTPPTHPELLDWLASELVESGWSMKHIHRLIVTSATYQLSTSAANAEGNQSRDPANVEYWRRTPQRLESQAVRDALLSLSGALDETRGGPSIPAAQQAESKRRSLYFFHSNNERNLFLTMFDEALVKDCYRREQSIVPQQALALSNSRLVQDAATAITARIERGPTLDDRAFIHAAFGLVLGSTPNAAELQASETALTAWKQLADGTSARSQFVWVLLNHNDFVTVR